MADKKISELTSLGVGAITGGTEIPAALTGATYKITVADLLAAHAAATISPHGSGSISQDMIANRTRKQLVPAVASRTIAGVEAVYGAQGWVLTAGLQTTAYGNWKVPQDYVSGLTVSGVWIRITGGASANVSVALFCTYSANGEAYSTHTNNSIDAAFSPALQDVRQSVLSVACANASAGDVVDMNFSYDNDGVGDPAFTFNFCGFEVSYTADS